MIDFQKKIYNTLIKDYSFFIKEYYSKYENDSRWIAINDLGEVIFAIIVTDDSSEEINFLEAHVYLKGAYDKPHLLSTIVIAKGEYIESHCSKSKIVYSQNENKVIYFTKDLCYLKHALEESIEQSRKINLISWISNNKITFLLITLNVTIYVILSILSKNFIYIDGEVLIKFGAKINYLIEKGQVWRLLTSAFLHGGILHLSFNMYALIVLGSQNEKIYGWKKYIFIYIISAIGGSALSYLFMPRSVSVGASGAIFGLLGSLLILAIRSKNKNRKSVILNIIQVIVLNIILGMSVDNIDNYGHIGGLLAGVLTSYILSLKDRERNDKSVNYK